MSPLGGGFPIESIALAIDDRANTATGRRKRCKNAFSIGQIYLALLGTSYKNSKLDYFQAFRGHIQVDAHSSTDRLESKRLKRTIRGEHLPIFERLAAADNISAFY
jgi:hypothetical protein